MDILKKRLQFLFLCLSFFYNHIQSVLVKAEKLTSPDFNGHPKQFYLYYNVHNTPHTSIDFEQLSAMQSILAKREQEESDQLHILLEQPPSGVKLSDQKLAITTDLAKCIKDLRHTTVENAEIRCVSNAAAFLLRETTNPCTVYPKLVFDTARKRCFVGDITVADLINEYDNCWQEIHQLRSSLSPKLGNVLYGEVCILNKEYERLKNKIKELRLRPEDNFFALAKQIYTKEELHQVRYQLLSAISTPFDHLFELYLFKRMIELNTSKIAVIASVIHTQFLKQMLEQAGAKRRIFYTNGYSRGGRPILLMPQQLNLFD